MSRTLFGSPLSPTNNIMLRKKHNSFTFTCSSASLRINPFTKSADSITITLSCVSPSVHQDIIDDGQAPSSLVATYTSEHDFMYLPIPRTSQFTTSTSVTEHAYLSVQKYTRCNIDHASPCHPHLFCTYLHSDQKLSISHIRSLLLLDDNIFLQLALLYRRNTFNSYHKHLACIAHPLPHASRLHMWTSTACSRWVAPSCKKEETW